jgi:23S rRNA-intervening sequence protein
MAKYNHLPIFQLAYNLILEIYKTTHQFSREHKYTLGQKLKDAGIEFIDFIISANSKENKVFSLEEARIRLERVRIYIRLSFNLRIITLKRYEFFSRSLEDLSKQLFGWQDWARNFSEPESLSLRVQRAS